MASMRLMVYALLLSTGVPVYYAWPARRRTLPMLCYRECRNRAYRAADGGEYLTEACYAVDVYAATVEGAAALAEAADGRLSGAGFIRESSEDGTADGARRITMKFRALADPAGNIYP
jgi:hypothetical protein